MNCEQAQRIFDAYLDGELPPTLATELGAHRLRCAKCRRALALLEVSGHILTSDDDPVTLSDGFEDRLLACVEDGTSLRHRFRKVLYVAMPLAAAAVVALAFIGAFDRSTGQVLGEKQNAIESAGVDPILLELEASDDSELEAEEDPRALELDRWGQRTQKNLQSFQDLTIYQWLDVLEKAKDTTRIEDHYPGADPLADPDHQDDLAIPEPDEGGI
jgi:hypothetical protein